MNPSVASLIALLIAIILSIAMRINVGVVSIALAWLVGVYIAGLKVDAILSGFPSSLFITLTGVTLLFACAEANGTLKSLADGTVNIVRGNRKMLPLLFFLLGFLVSTVGPGAISSVALIVPLAMVIGDRAGLSPLLTSLMVANGANAGNLSPVSAVGVIANTKMAEAGIGGHEWKVWGANFTAHLLVAAAAWLLFGRKPAETDPASTGDEAPREPFTLCQLITIAVIGLWIIGALAAKLNLGLSAFAAAALLLLARCADQKKALARVQWGVIIMVTGVSVLISLLEKTGGMELFTSLLARLATPGSINGVIAFVTGAISTYSSTSGVVLPAFLPTAPLLASQLGGGDPLAIALSINVGSSIVDVSPLSTLGALCLATVHDPATAQQLFRRLMLWGFSMTLIGAAFSQLFAGVIARM